jgi:hypothetical protein
MITRYLLTFFWVAANKDELLEMITTTVCLKIFLIFISIIYVRIDNGRYTTNLNKVIDSMFLWVRPSGFHTQSGSESHWHPFYLFILVPPSRKSCLQSQWKSNSLLLILYRLPQSRFVIVLLFSVLLGRFCHLG